MDDKAWDRILRQLQEKVRQGKFILTIHADEEMENDDLCLDDVLNGVLTGEIQAQQKDTVAKGLKYRIRGQCLAGDEIEIVAKIGATGKAVVITVYRL